MADLEVKLAGVTLRNPLVLASATPSWDGMRSNLAWRAGFGAVVPKSFAPPNRWAQHPRCGRMKLIKSGKKRIGMVNIELYTTMPLQAWLDNELDKASMGAGGRIHQEIETDDNTTDYYHEKRSALLTIYFALPEMYDAIMTKGKRQDSSKEDKYKTSGHIGGVAVPLVIQGDQ